MVKNYCLTLSVRGTSLYVRIMAYQVYKDDPSCKRVHLILTSDYSISVQGIRVGSNTKQYYLQARPLFYVSRAGAS